MTDDVDATRDPAIDFDSVAMRSLLDTPGTILFFKDLDSRFIKVSVDCARLANRTQEEMVGLTDFDLTDEAHARELLADEQRIIATGEPILEKEEADRLADRPGTWVETSKFPLRAADGTIIGTFGYSRDVSRWELAEKELEQMATELAEAHGRLLEVEVQLRAVLNGSLDAIALFDREARYRYINPAGERFLGRTMDEVVGRTVQESGMPAAWLAIAEKALRAVVDTGEPQEVEFAALGPPEHESAWYHASLSADRDAHGAVVGVLASIRDVTPIKRAERMQAHLALHDPLTGLANRALLTDRLEKALVRLERTPGRVGLVYIDLDFFKEINDSHGHVLGDRVLVDTARRLLQVARREDTVARLGGDEFVVMCGNVAPGDVEAIADRIVRVLSEPFDEEGAVLRASASVGAAATEDPTVSASALMHAADSAMYRAKSLGRNRFVLAPPS